MFAVHVAHERREDAWVRTGSDGFKKLALVRCIIGRGDTEKVAWLAIACREKAKDTGVCGKSEMRLKETKRHSMACRRYQHTPTATSDASWPPAWPIWTAP